MKLRFIVLVLSPMLLPGCATDSGPSTAPAPVVVVPADPTRDQINSPNTAAPDPTAHKPTISDPGLQFLHPQ